MNWNKTSEKNPPRGEPVIVVIPTGDKEYETDVAYYCDGSYYALKIDPNLDILRKVCIPKPEYWTAVAPQVNGL